MPTQRELDVITAPIKRSKEITFAFASLEGAGCMEGQERLSPVPTRPLTGCVNLRLHTLSRLQFPDLQIGS